MTRRWSTSLFMLCFAAGYLVQKLGWVPVLVYYPRLHLWSFAEGLDAEGPAMKWYGRLLGCALLAGSGWVLGRVVELRTGDGKALATLDCASWAAVYLVMGYSAYYELSHWVF